MVTIFQFVEITGCCWMRKIDIYLRVKFSHYLRTFSFYVSASPIKREWKTEKRIKIVVMTQTICVITETQKIHKWQIKSYHQRTNPFLLYFLDKKFLDSSWISLSESSMTSVNNNDDDIFTVQQNRRSASTYAMWFDW